MKTLLEKAERFDRYAKEIKYILKEYDASYNCN